MTNMNQKLMLMLVIVIESYVRVQKTAVIRPIDLNRLLWRQPCRLQEIEDDAGDTPAATEKRSIVDRSLAE